MNYFSGGLLHLLEKILNSGVKPGMSVEEESAANKANLCCLMAVLLGLTLLAEGVRLGAYYLFAVASLTVAGAVLCFAVLAHTGRPFFPTLLLVSWISAFFLSLVSTGGRTGTGYVFVFFLPLLYFFTFPARVALLLFTLLMSGLTAVLFMPGTPLLLTEYSLLTRQRIFIMYVFFGGIALLGEFVRWRAQQKIARLVDELVAASRTDQLTGLYNRRAFQERFQYEAARSVREKRPLSIVLFDIDYFKNINDEYGHACGDEALRQLAGLVRAVVRQQDTVARWGGEEFIILLPGTGQEGAMVLAEKLRAKVEAAFYSCDGARIHFTISLGVHHCDLAESVDATISQVDAKLYHAKHLGRNRVCGVLPMSVPLHTGAA